MAIPELQEEFAQYLTANYNYSHPRHMASEVFYSYRHDIGIPFEEIFRSDTSMEHAKELLIQYFERIGRKSLISVVLAIDGDVSAIKCKVLI